MKKNGFTLIELLAVISLLAILAVFTTTAVAKLIKDSRNDLSDIQIASIKSASEAWGVENLSKLPDAGECKYITLNDLKESGLLDSNIIDPKTNEQISNTLYIKISTTNKAGKDIVSYEVNPESIDGCKRILKGDVNNDGIVDSQDAIDLSYYLFTELNGSTIADPSNGDMDGDNKITVKDVNYLSQHLGLVKSSIPNGLGLLGDVNGDGIITFVENNTNNDAGIILRYLAQTITIDSFVSNNSDLNNDGFITLADSTLIQRAIEGLIYVDV